MQIDGNVGVDPLTKLIDRGITLEVDDLEFAKRASHRTPVRVVNSGQKPATDEFGDLAAMPLHGRSRENRFTDQRLTKVR